MAQKTTPILLKDGTSGRGVKITAKNTYSVAKWIGKDDVELATDDRVKLLTGPNHAQPRNAVEGDVVVKIGKGKDAYYVVIKAEDFAKYVKI